MGSLTVLLLAAFQLTVVKREKFAKIQEKYFNTRVVIFTVQRLIFYQCPVNLLTCFELYFQSPKYLKVGKFGLVVAIFSKQQGFVSVRGKA